MTNLTKKALIEALTELLEEKALDKITVKEITDRCGLSRNTFYYHYHDVYELIARYFADEADHIMKNYMSKHLSAEGLLQGLNFLYENKTIIKHVYVSVSRSEVDRFIRNLVYGHTQSVISQEASSKKYSNDVISIVADFYTNAVVGGVFTWIEDDMKDDPEMMANLYNNLFMGTIDRALKSAEESL